ncbi:Cytochrome P450 6a2 [Gryllus bimaculatus]|nr:Cytochrome P450 6a2 [Gryllus bimaculatus]
MANKRSKYTHQQLWQQHPLQIQDEPCKDNSRRLCSMKMNDGVMAAQAFVFFAAGFETSSTTMSFALHELAVNTDIQEKVRKEIDTSLEETGGEFTYESIMNLKYLDKVVSEQTSDLSTRKVII